MTTLYKQNKNKSVQQWSIQLLKDGKFQVTFGQVNGVMQTQITQCESKNIGRANETTPEEQAKLEVNALIAKKRKSGYVDDSSGLSQIRLPMKVKAYQQQLHNVEFPCFSSSKLDGVNAIYKRINGKLTIYSRGGEEYPPIPHLEPLVHQAMDLFHSNELNGELYIHGEFLQDIQSAVKKPNALSSKLSFCIFDIADSSEEFYERAMIMHKLNKFDTTINSTVSVIYNIICHSTKEIEEHYNECVNFGYEGTVIKNFNALYQHNVRSSSMFKYKKVKSAEFKILSYNLDKHGLPVFVLDSKAGKFKAKPKGSRDFWKLINPDEYIGNWATCEYETLSKSGKPLKPIFITLRECTDDGLPII